MSKSAKLIVYNWDGKESSLPKESDFIFCQQFENAVIEIRKLIQRETLFDFIYIDGSHNGEDVIVDAIESFKILKKHGIMVFDDAMLDIDKNKKYQTYEGVISFINMFKKEIEIMYLRNILIIKKISE